MPSILNTNTNILMRLYVSTEEVVTKYEIYGGSCVHIPPTHTNNLLDLDFLSNSLIRELKIRFVGLVL